MATEARPRSNRLLMVLGIIVAVVAFLIVFLLYGTKGGGGGTSGQTTSVVVAAVDIPVGTQISEQLVTTVSVSAATAPADAFSAVNCPKDQPSCTNAAVGQFAAVALPKNTILSQSNVVSSVSKLPPVKKPYLDIPTGDVAVSVPAGGELQAVGGWIQPGDRVDVIATGLPGEKSGVWKTVFENLIIQRVGPVGSANTQGLSSSYILYVPLAQAEEVTYFFANSTYKMALKSPTDYKPDDALTPGTTAGVDQNAFNAKYGVPK